MKQIFIAASLALMVASCTTPQGSSTLSSAQPTSTAATLAYVNVEKVLSECDIFVKEGMPLQQRTETAQREWAQKEQKLQSEAAQLQQKYQSGLITTANAQKEQQAIESRVAAFQKATQSQAAELDEENTVFANRTQKLLRSAVESINADKRYSMIINASALIDADSTLDISTIVLDELNKLYKEEK